MEIDALFHDEESRNANVGHKKKPTQEAYIGCNIRHFLTS